jgi:Carboxypeptidase regulatory-like domain
MIQARIDPWRPVELRGRSVLSARWRLRPFRALAFALAWALAHALQAQALPQKVSNLEGRVLNDQNAPLSAAVCTLTGNLLPPGGLTVNTDRDGKFTFLQLSPGSYKLACAAMGFKPVGKQLELGPEAPFVEVVLPVEQILRQTVEVRAKGPATGLEQGAPPATISSSQIADLPLTEQKFKAALPLIPGVVRTPDGKINIKGVPENQGLLLLDAAENVDPVTGSFSIDVPIQAIESLQVYKNAYRADYGGFSGGLTSISTKPPLGQWHYEIEDFTPNPRIKSGTLVGIANFNPRLYVTGPILANRLNFSEALGYDVDKQPVRGLAWPHNEILSHDFLSFTTFQYFFSAEHVATVTTNVFPLVREFANINSLVPQSASSNYGQHGFSIALTDRYRASSGVVFTTLAQGMSFGSYGHGQGSKNMLVTPNGWDGNFFNAFDRESDEEQINETVTLPARDLYGKHDLTLGGGFIQRAFRGSSQSHPVQILRADGTLAERIDFTGPGQMSASDAEGAAFAQDHWTLTEQLGVDLGLRLTGQTLGAPLNLAPRLGLVYSPGTDGKTVIRAGFGVFYSHVPLLVGGFTQNPVRQVSLYDAKGNSLGPPLVFGNFYGNLTGDGQNPSLSLTAPNRTPYNLTASLEVDRELSPKVTLRLAALASRSRDDLIVDPLATTPPSGPALVLSPTGGSRYHEFESTLHFRLSANSEWSVSYINSRARGNLNTLNQVYVPFEEPVIRPDAYTYLPSDIPNRLIAWGRLPTHFWGIEASPVVDWHSGFPYSFLNEYQDYASVPNGERFPRFFSVDLKLGKEFRLPLPWVKNHLLRGSLTIFNLTNHNNPRDVYNNITSPYFNHFVGLQHLFFDSELDIVY